jgi:hypothetical protein
VTSTIGKMRAERDIVLREIQTASGQENVRRVLDLSERLRRIDSLLGQHDSLEAEAQALLSDSGKDRPVTVEPAGRDQIVATRTGRGHGAEIRSEFLRNAASRGLKLLPHRGAIYATAQGVRIGVAVATERQANRWFLGLAENGFDSAVLLCHTVGRRTIDVCLPSSFLRSQQSRLSRAGGQLKFNVVRRDGEMHLTIPGVGHVPVQKYVGAVEQLGLT